MWRIIQESHSRRYSDQSRSNDNSGQFVSGLASERLVSSEIHHRCLGGSRGRYPLHDRIGAATTAISSLSFRMDLGIGNGRCAAADNCNLLSAESTRYISCCCGGTDPRRQHRPSHLHHYRYSLNCKPTTSGHCSHYLAFTQVSDPASFTAKSEIKMCSGL